MNPSIATLVYAVGIAGLFYLNHDKSVRTSKALWLPVIYLLALGSRPVSFWLGVPPPNIGTVDLQGSPIDEVFFAVLLVAALWVIIRRGDRVRKALSASGPILIYFFFCLLSVLWSDFPVVAGKRWVKAVGDLVMILVVLTDAHPAAALGRLYSRTAFVLIPFSLLFIKYFPLLGRSYDPWTGRQMFTGLTGDKNVLGVITFVLLLGTVWRVLGLLRSDEKTSHRRRILFAQGTVLVLGVYILLIANSVTSLVAFALGSILMLATSLRFMKRHLVAVHALVLMLVVAVISVMFLGGKESAAQALGRDSTFSGRTEIWATVIPLASNPLVGAGFESFWLSPQVHEKLWEVMPGLPLNEAHDGYIEVYLELGLVGVGLIAFILIDGYRRAFAAFRREPAWGGLLIAYTVSATVYSITEAGFRMMDPIWIFLLLAVVASGCIASGVVGESSRFRGVAADAARRRTKDKQMAARAVVRSI